MQIASMNESRERIRREREREKNTYTSPRLALRRVLLLAEGRQFREAAAVLARLGPGVLQSVAAELPIDLMVEALPHSAHLIETLLNRLISLEVSPRPELQCETVAWRLVGLLGSDQGSGLRARTARLASALVHYTPDTKETIDARRRQLDAAVQGLGTHGLTADSSGTLISLHVAMKNELQRHVDVYKQALHKLEELSSVTVNQDPASSSHQRLLALSHADVERRLIDNKSLLTIVDKPALRQLPTLVSSLAARVESDKAVLACVGQIKRSDPTLDLSDTRPVAGVLMSYSRGCAAVLTQMTEGETTGSSPVAPRSPTDSASDGYHSDSDDSHQHPDRSKLVSQYAAVWARAADEALPALSALEQLRQTPHLKYKIVFSIVVMTMNLEHQYCVVEIKCGRYDGHHVIVPKSWILLYNPDDGAAALKYPTGPLPGLQQWVEGKRKYLKEWGDFPGYVKFESDSYEEAKEYIDSLITDDEDEPEAKKTKTEETPKPKDSERSSIEIELQQLQIVLPKLEISEIQQTGKKSESKIINEDTSLNQKEISTTTSNSTEPQKVEKPSNLSNQLEVIMSEEYLTLLNKCYSENQEISDTLELMRQTYVKKCAVIKKAIEWITRFKGRHKKLHKTSVNSPIDITIGSNNQKQQNISQTIDNLCEITAAVINATKESENLLHLQKIVTGNTSFDLNKMQQRKNDVEIRNKEINERENIPAYEIIEDEDDIINNNLEMPLNQPTENKNNNTKWTLKHPNMKTGLVELIKGSRVYVTEKSLNVHKYYTKSSKLVYRLLYDIFSKEALISCAFSDNTFENKSGLDQHGLDVLIAYVNKLKAKKFWPGLNVRASVRFQLQHIQKEHQTNLINRSHKKKKCSKNSSSQIEEINKAQKMLDISAANNTAYFFLRNK